MRWQRKKKNRRLSSKTAPSPRFGAVFTTPGARRVVNVSLLLLIVSAAGWQLHRWLEDMDNLTLQRVQVEGRFHYLQPERVRALLGAYAGRNFFDVDVAAIKHDLEQQPWIREASVRRQWPDSLTVKLYEQVPVARWGARGLMNGDAVIFYPSGSAPQQAFTDLPRLGGTDDSAPELLTRLRDVAGRLAPLGLQVAAMELDARRAWRITLANGLELLMGRQQAMQRMQRFLTFYPLVLAQRVDSVEAVDLRYPNGFVLRWSAAAARAPLG